LSCWLLCAYAVALQESAHLQKSAHPYRVKVYSNEHPPIYEMVSGTPVGLSAPKQWKTQRSCIFESHFAYD